MLTSSRPEGEQQVSLMPHLLITKGPQRGETIPLDFNRLETTPLTLGRRAGEADFVLQSFQNRISRKHATISYRSEDELAIVSDAGSANGTTLNGDYLAGPTPLLPGDTIGCGDVELIFVVPITAMGLPLARLPGQTERFYLEDSEPGVARLEVIASRVPGLRPGAFARLTPRHPFLIGRFSTNDLPLLEADEEARLVSRRHAEIRWGGQGYIIRDMGAANPAWINQNQIDSVRPLDDGDRIQIGTTLLLYRAPRLALAAGPVEAAGKTAATTAVLRFASRRPLLSGPDRVVLPVSRQILIGRAEGNDLRLFDQSVSRRHVQLFHEANRFLLLDVGSANGTRVNGQYLTGAAVLQSGDRLQIGEFEFIFEEMTPDETQPGPPALHEPVTLQLQNGPTPATPSGSPADPATLTAPATEAEAAEAPITHPLRQVAPFDELDSAAFRLLEPFFKEVRFKTGQEMAREGQNRGAFFVIVEGRVTISRALDERQRLVVGELEPGSVYGERTITANQPFANRLEAATPVRALRLEEAVFVRELARHRNLITFFQQQVSAASATTWMRATLLMRTLSDKTRKEMSRRLRFRQYAPGEVLAEQGQPATEFFMVMGGRAIAYLKDKKNHETYLATLEEGDTFGDGIAAPAETYPMTVRAEKVVECYVLARADFDTVLAKSGDPIASLGSGLGGLPLGAVLNRVGPFMTMPPQLVAKIAAEMKPKFFRKGETIVSQDEPASAFYIVRSGKVEVSFRTSEGQVRADNQLGPGQYFGEGSLLTNTARTDTVTALEDCELLALYRNKLEAVLKLGASYDLGQYFARGLSKSFRPKRVQGVEASEQTSAGGEHHYLLSRGDGEQFFKLSDRGYFLWNLMNGDNSLNDLSMAYFLEFKSLDLEGVSNIVGQLQAGGYLEVPPIDESLLSQGRRKRSLAARVFNWRRDIGNVDRLFDRLYHFGGQVFFWRPVVWLLAVLGVVGFGAFLYFGFFDAQASQTGILRLFQGGGLGALTLPGALPWWSLIIVLFGNMLIHEIAHGLACKAYGRKVIAAGYGWQFIGPVFYVNTNDIWLEKRRPRIVVSLAGPFCNALFAGCCALLMFLTPQNAALKTALFQMAGIGYILFYLNINPLLELDGYYALMDWLEVPGLRRKALTFVRRKLFKHPGGRTVPPREQGIYWWFAALTPVYLLFTIVQFLFFLRSVLGSLNPGGVLARLGLPEGWGDGLVLALALAIVAALSWPLVAELLTIGREEDPSELAAHRKLARRRRRKR